ncbi:GNAT family N-acetyltransferase [Undibacterium sp. RuTC16W]|uniref:GNAT family N-acetyltransferase n=1 Tax=Undibacterium sp. RuTC16W TaxID=3413048 RepID=UPI003BF1AF87
MPTLNFKLADSQVHRKEILSMNNEYMTWVVAGIESSFGIQVADLLGMSVPEYSESMMNKVCSDTPPHGVFYLVELEDELAGMVGLRYLNTGIAEIKRLYVRPGFRGKHLGEAFLRKILSDAKAFGYQHVVLDTAPFMLSAQHLYKSMGFNDCAPYEGTEVARSLHNSWHFMEMDLNKAKVNQPISRQ